MTATLPPRAVTGAALAPADGIELLGPVHGSGYRDGAALVRRADGQMIQLGPLMYAVLDFVDGRRDNAAVAAEMSSRLGRNVTEEHVSQIADKLAAQGLLAGSESAAPPRSNPLLALRWKVLVTKPQLTRRLTAPFAFLFRPWILWPVLAAFVGVCWFVLVEKGVASATSQAFNRPGLLLGIFAIAVLSAGIHELGHAAACKYGGATPGGMGAGLYLVWPAFYTDVTDAYRLDRRSRLRVDLGGLYFNALVAVVTVAVWLAIRVDALLLLVALQLLQMVKQLSPIIRADGYHILADATGVPDLYAHLGPTLRRLLPGHRHEPSALTGRARFIVTAWVLVIVPVLVALMLGAVLVFPRLLTTAWDSGRHIVHGLPHEVASAHILAALADLFRLVALLLPVLGVAMISVRLGRTIARKAAAWSRGRPVRRTGVLAATAAVIAGLVFAWWPSGQYQAVSASDRGTLPGFFHLLSNNRAAPAGLSSGRHLALAMVPVGGASATHPVLYVVPGQDGKATALLSGATDGRAVTFPFKLPGPVGPNDTQALSVNTTDGGVAYDVEYAIITVSNGDAVNETNSAFAIASCRACTTVAVSFQLVLIVGQSNVIAPIDAAGALNYKCPACMTTALAEQMVITLKAQPPASLQRQLEAELQKLDAISLLGKNGTPAAVAAAVAAVERQIENELRTSGLMTNTTTTTVQTSPTPVPSTTANPGPIIATPGSPAQTAVPGATPSSSGQPSPAGSSAPSASPNPTASG